MPLSPKLRSELIQTMVQGLVQWCMNCRSPLAGHCITCSPVGAVPGQPGQSCVLCASRWAPTPWHETPQRHPLKASAVILENIDSHQSFAEVLGSLGIQFKPIGNPPRSPDLDPAQLMPVCATSRCGRRRRLLPIKDLSTPRQN